MTLTINSPDASALEKNVYNFQSESGPSRSAISLINVLCKFKLHAYHSAKIGMPDSTGALVEASPPSVVELVVVVGLGLAFGDLSLLFVICSS